MPISAAIRKFVGCLLEGDTEGVSAALNDDLLNNPSCHDFNNENSYHIFIYGMLLALSEDYIVTSNLESGKGRYTRDPEDLQDYCAGYLPPGGAENPKECLWPFKDFPCRMAANRQARNCKSSGSRVLDCQIKPLDKGRPAVVMEFKHLDALPGDLKKEARKGLEQIGAKSYTHNLKREGYGRIYKYGIAFHKKNCEVVMETA